MNAPREPPRLRITVLLAATGRDDSALELLKLLASDTPAEILGLFVEDINLLNLAELPVAREYCRLTHTERRLESIDLERQFRIQARAAERALGTIAGSAGYTWRFRTVRGVLDTLLTEALEEMDLMLLTATRQTPRPLQGNPSPTGIAHRARHPIAVIYNGSEAAQHALGLARRMTRMSGQRLSVLLVAEDLREAEALHQQASTLLESTPAVFHEYIQTDAGELLQAVRSQQASTLILASDAPVLLQDGIEMLLEKLSCPAVLIK